MSAVNPVVGAVDKVFWSNAQNSLYSEKEGHERMTEAKFQYHLEEDQCQAFCYLWKM